jgi:hypothetical protein
MYAPNNQHYKMTSVQGFNSVNNGAKAAADAMGLPSARARAPWPTDCDDLKCPADCNSTANCEKKYSRDATCVDQYGVLSTDTLADCGPKPETDYNCAKCPVYAWTIGPWKPAA